MVPRQIREAVELIVAGQTAPPRPLTWEPIGGGSINNTYRIRAANPVSQQSQWFCKTNTLADFPGMFEKEIRGLNLLQTLGGMRVPQVIGHAIAGEYQVLVLEWIDEDQDSNHDSQQGQPGGLKTIGGDQHSSSALFWTTFGESVARMHRVRGNSFGLEEDNFMGALPQSNTLSDQWTEFFIHQRLEPQLRLAVDKSLLTRPHICAFEGLYKQLPAIFPEEPPALLHGDLWSGNFLRGRTSELKPGLGLELGPGSESGPASGGQPVLIDPAVYYGHRSMDLAMTTLFGGFDLRFYESYHAHYPLPANHEEQWAVCNLYPLLIHLNLFGAGYLGEILESLERFS